MHSASQKSSFLRNICTIILRFFHLFFHPNAAFKRLKLSMG